MIQTLLEALNYKQHVLINNMRRDADYFSGYAHQDLFNRYNSGYPNRIILPLEKPKTTPDKEIQKHLAKNGWFVYNYTEGLAGKYSADRDGNKKLQLKSIGKVLQQTGADKINHSQPLDRLIKGSDGQPIVGSNGRMKNEIVPQSLLHFYNNDKARDSARHETNMIISRDVDDIGGMSSGRSWEADSCMRLPHSDNKDPRCNDAGAYHKKIKQDFKHHTLVVYATKKGDTAIENPLGRVLLKKFVSPKKHVIYRLGSKIYGNPPPEFHEAVKKFSEDNWPAHDNTTYKLHKDLYQDTHPVANTPYSTGLQKYQDGHRFLNKRGHLEDFTDENGIRQPAYINNNTGMITTTHFKDGERHNENGVAETVQWPNGSKLSSHYIDGKLHNPNGAAIKFEGKGGVNSKDIHEEHHIDGMLHRDGDLPALHIKTKYGTEKTFSRYGLKHRDGDLPSVVNIKPTGESLTEYHQYDELHREGDKPTRKNVFRNDNGEIVKSITQYHKNGKLHRDNDQPSNVEIDGDIVKKQWHRNGNLHRDGDKPSEIIYNKKTKQIISKKWNKFGELSREGNKPVSIGTDSYGNVEKTFKLPNGDYHNIKKYKDGINHSWDSDIGNSAWKNDNEINVDNSDKFKRSVKLVPDSKGNIHVKSFDRYDTHSIFDHYPVIMKDGTVTKAMPDTDDVNNVEKSKLYAQEDLGERDDYQRNKNLRELNIRLQAGIDNPYVGKYFKKAHKMVKDWGIPISKY